MKYSISGGSATENSVAYFARGKEEGVKTVVNKDGKIETKKIRTDRTELKETRTVILGVSILKEIMYHTGNKTFVFGVSMMLCLICILAIILIASQKEKRKFHGAEHKVFHWYKSGCKDKTKVKEYSRISPLCGTNILSVYMVMQILMAMAIFCEIHITEAWVILFINYASKFPLSLPGMLIQYVTTAEPDELHIKVATKALEALVEEDE